MVRIVVIRHILRDSEPGEHLHRGLAPDVERTVFVRIEVEQSVVVVDTAGQIVAQAAHRPRRGKIMRMGENAFLVEGVVVVGVAVVDVSAVRVERRLTGIAVQFAEAEVVHPAH